MCICDPRPQEEAPAHSPLIPPTPLTGQQRSKLESAKKPGYQREHQAKSGQIGQIIFRNLDIKRSLDEGGFFKVSSKVFSL